MHIVLATYNLWNMMFHWSIRKHYIAEMISDANIDIIALQEVCGDIKQYRSQINDLQELLPVYQYTYISYAKKNNQNPFCEMEGLGILSKHKITNMFSMNLSRSLSSSDMNNRVALHLQFSIQPGDYELALIVVHFSTDRQQQCENVVELIKYIYAVGGENMVILGDFNAYQDFTWPVNALMNGKFSKEAPMSCRRKGIIFDTEQYRGYGYLFSDVWKSIYPKYSGLTFSNMPTPGFINRPDRILVSNSGLKVLSTVLMGRGQRYALKYVNSLWWERLRIIYKSMYFNQEPSQCAGTCGPHGSCRCGVCISGGNNNACADHFCTECSIQKFLIIHFALFILVASFLFLFISLVSKLLRRKFFLTFCFSRSNLQFLHQNYIIFFALIICICSCMCLEVILKDILLLVDAQLPEELHPSDHLMVISKINLL